MNGVLLLNKPRGMTSHDCVAKLRGILGTKKIGHTGTLDPDVDGVLPICVGPATKVVQFLTAEAKEYLGEVTIGYSTTTEDASGEVVKRKLVSEEIGAKKVKAILQDMIGSQIQTPPMFSAVRVNGKRLYEYAREGLEVERPQREVTIFELELLGDIVHINGLVKFRFRVRGSKGIFIRTVAVTIGEKLGYPAHMSDLTRYASGHFKLENCVNFDDIQAGNFKLIPIEDALLDFPSIKVEGWVEKLVRNGVKLRDEQISPMIKDGPFLVKTTGGLPLSIHEWNEERKCYNSIRGLW